MDGEPGGTEVFTVGEITTRIRDLLEAAFPRVWVEGEISNCSRAASGHLYFSLRDDRAQLPCAMFRGDNRQIEFEPRDGLRVMARGRVTIYPPSGRYQLIVSTLKPLGVGRLHLEFERLKERLAAEGLFDAVRKRPLPPYPRRIGVVTSSKGAAIRDIVSVLERRWPVAEVVLYPVRVQGEGSAEEIAAAIGDIDRRGGADVLIVGRGGGSLEDLWAFNEEVVARAIAAARTPVVSAVGHEIDFSIADFTADLRAPTPSAAAELVAPDGPGLRDRLDAMDHTLRRDLRIAWERVARRFEHLASRHGLRRLPARIEEAMQRLDQNDLEMRRRLTERFRRSAAALAEQAGRLDLLSPLATLGRGYSLTFRLPGGEIVRETGQLREGDRVRVRLGRGQIRCRVQEVES